MSRIRADRVTNKEGTGAPLFPNGIRVVGLTSLSNVVAGVTTFTSDVSIGGTLTYEDVTNIDSVGLITARTGIKVLAGGINVVGVITATSYDGITAIQAGNTSVQTVDTGSDGHVKMTTEGTERVRVNNTTGVNTLDVLGGARADYFVGRSNQSAPTADASIFRAADNTLAFATSNTERLRIGSAGQIGIAGANYGTAGQVLSSQGASAAPQWATVASSPIELVESFVSPNSAYVTFDNLTKTNVSYYLIKWTGVTFDASYTPRNPRAQFKIGGSYLTANNTYNQRHATMEFFTTSNEFYSYYDREDLFLSKAESGSISMGEMHIPMQSPNVTTNNAGDKYCYGKCINGNYMNEFYCNIRDSTPQTGDITAVRFFANSGNIGYSGRFDLYKYNY